MMVARMLTYLALIVTAISSNGCRLQRQPTGCTRHESIVQLFPKPLVIHLLYVKPNDQCQVDLEISSPSEKRLQTVSQMAQKRHAIAAINGSFFIEGKHTSSPIHISKKGDTWLSDPFLQRAAIGWNLGGQNALIGRLGMKWELEIAGKRYPIGRINKPRNYKNTILYTPALGTKTSNHSRGTEVIIWQGRVAEIKKNVGAMTVPENGYIYSLGPESGVDLSGIMLGDPVVLRYEFIPHDVNSNTTIHDVAWGEMDTILGGTPVLVSNGKIVENFYIDETSRKFIDLPHARTAIGLLADGTWVMAVVDGGNPFHSYGMSIPELASFMKELGVVNAINLDGGSSSTFYYQGFLRNFPISARMKKDPGAGPLVSDAIVVIDKNAS